MGKMADEKKQQEDMDLLQNTIKERLAELLGQIEDTAQLERIYRFTQYIYIHRT